MRVRCGLRRRQGRLFALAAALACAPIGTSIYTPMWAQTSATHPQSTTQQYIAPHDLHVKPGGAPGMKVKLIGSNGPIREYVVIFSRGDEALSGLTDFARQYHVDDAHFRAIGALEGGTLAWFDPQRKAYRLIPVPGQTEVASMAGDIAAYQGNPVVHTHAVLGMPDGSARAGHVIEAHVSPTLEVFVTADAGSLHKKLDESTGLTLIDPAAKE